MNVLRSCAMFARLLVHSYGPWLHNAGTCSRKAGTPAVLAKAVGQLDKAPGGLKNPCQHSDEWHSGLAKASGHNAGKVGGQARLASRYADEPGVMNEWPGHSDEWMQTRNK